MQSNEIKYLGYGLGIGAIIASFLLGGTLFLSKTGAFNTVTPTITNTFLPSATFTATPQNTSTFTPTPTLLPPATSLPSPTTTPSSTELLIASGEVYIVGPLTRDQQIKLYETSLGFISPTFEQSRQMSVQVNNMPASDPSTVCGPLSMAILQSAGILQEDLVPFDFFLINPDNVKDRRILATAFPQDQYKNTRYRIKLNKFPWASYPLLPGDFVYIYSGTQGNFEHMLIVTRVDYQGRAYSVTNHDTEEGFIIDEVMLYDPRDPNVGIFAQWTKREKQVLGSTGFAGFEVWRLIQ